VPLRPAEQAPEPVDRRLPALGKRPELAPARGGRVASDSAWSSRPP